MSQSSSASSDVLREEENEDFMRFPDINEDSYQMYEASARQSKHKNNVTFSKPNTTREKHENTPIKEYGSDWTRSPQINVSNLQSAFSLNTQILPDDELVRMDKMLVAKREEWKKRMEIVAKRKTELLKGQKSRNQLMSKLLKDNKVKKQQAKERWAEDQKTNKIKQEEIEHLNQELRDLRIRKLNLKKKMEKYRRFEDFLSKVLDKLPKCFRSWELNSSIKNIMNHYEMLSKTNKSLINQVSSLSDAHKKAQKSLEALQLEYNNSTLILNTELSTLQKKLDEVKESNKEIKTVIHMKKKISKDKNQDLESMLTVITNLANQCQIRSDSPTKQMDLGCKLEMIQEFILDKMLTKKLADSQKFWISKPIDIHPQKIQGPGKMKLTDRISAQPCSRTFLSKITIPQETFIRLPATASPLPQALNLPRSQKV